MELVISKYIVYIYPFLAVLLIVEFMIAREQFIKKETWGSLAIALGATLMASAMKLVALTILIFVFEATKDLRLDLLGYETFGWAWYVWIFAILGDDFNFYWHHRLCHEVRLLWALHIPHHNSETFNFTVALRNGWFMFFWKPSLWLWMPLVGFEPVMIATALIINSTYQYWLHTTMIPSLGILEKVFNSPYLHVVHHSSNVEYMDKNHGGILVIWDRIFGTYLKPIKGLTPQYGVTKGPGSYNPFIANVHEFGNIWKDVSKVDRWADKIKYIFYPPGWSHDGSTITAKEMQLQLAQNRLRVDEARRY